MLICLPTVTFIGFKWRYHSLILTAFGSDLEATLNISGAVQGVLFPDRVSLLPDQTRKDHGLQVYLAEALAELHPSEPQLPLTCNDLRRAVDYYIREWLT